MINQVKHRRLQADLEQLQMGLRAMSEDARYWANEHLVLRADVVSHMRQYPIGWDATRDPVSALLLFPKKDLDHMHVDPTNAHAAVNARERHTDLQTRIAALSARVSPLASLVNRLNKYVELGSN